MPVDCTEIGLPSNVPVKPSIPRSPFTCRRPRRTCSRCTCARSGSPGTSTARRSRQVRRGGGSAWRRIVVRRARAVASAHGEEPGRQEGRGARASAPRRRCRAAVGKAVDVVSGTHARAARRRSAASSRAARASRSRALAARQGGGRRARAPRPRAGGARAGGRAHGLRARRPRRSASAATRPAPATQADVDRPARGDRGAARRAQGVQARAGPPRVRRPASPRPRGPPRRSRPRSRRRRGTTAAPQHGREARRSGTAKPAAAKPAAADAAAARRPDVVPPAPGSTGASGATSTGRGPAGGAS